MKLRIMLAAVCALTALAAVAGSASAATPPGPFAMHLQPHLPGGTSLEIKFSADSDFVCGGSEISGTHIAGAVGFPAWKVEKTNFESCTNKSEIFNGGPAAISVTNMPSMAVVTSGQPPTTRLILANTKIFVNYFGCQATLTPKGGTLTASTPGTSMSSEIFENAPLTLASSSANCYIFFKSGTGTFTARYDSPFPPLEA